MFRISTHAPEALVRKGEWVSGYLKRCCFDISYTDIIGSRFRVCTDS